MKYKDYMPEKPDLILAIKSKEKFEKEVEDQILQLARKVDSSFKDKLVERSLYLCPIPEDEAERIEGLIKEDYLKSLEKQGLIKLNATMTEYEYQEEMPPPEIVVAQISFNPRAFIATATSKAKTKQPKILFQNQKCYLRFDKRENLTLIAKENSFQAKLLKLLFDNQGVELSVVNILEHLIAGKRKKSKLPFDPQKLLKIAGKTVKNTVKEIQSKLKAVGKNKILKFLFDDYKHPKRLTLNIP